MVRLLVVSEASVNLPHRKTYQVLARRTGWQVDIACAASVPLAGGRAKEADPPPGDAAYRLHLLPTRWSTQARLTWFSGLGRLLRQVKPDVAFVEYDPGSVVVLQVFAHRLGATRVIPFSPENIDHPRFRQAIGHLRDLKLKAAVRDLGVGVLNLAGRFASDGLACVNDEGHGIFLRNWGTRKPIATMPLGTDLTLFRPMDSSALRRSLGLADVHVVGYIGRLVPEKGVDLVIESLSFLPPDVRLLLDMFKNFDPGSYAAHLLERARALGVQDRVVTFDVPHERVAEYMNCCDVIVAPSRTAERWKEQFGRVLPEAMACGVPVIGSDSGNIPDVIGDAGVVVPEGSARAIAEAVLQLRSDPGLRRALVERAHARVRERLSVERQVDVLEQLVRSVVKRP